MMISNFRVLRFVVTIRETKYSVYCNLVVIKGTFRTGIIFDMPLKVRIGWQDLRARGAPREVGACHASWSTRETNRDIRASPNFRYIFPGICSEISWIRGKAIELEPRTPTSSDTRTHAPILTETDGGHRWNAALVVNLLIVTVKNIYNSYSKIHI